MLIPIINPPVDDLEQTYVSVAASSNASSLSVKNNASFANSQRILIGSPGTEGAEVRTCSGTTSVDTISFSANTSFGHPIDTPVYILRYDQLKIYKSSTIDGTYNLLATVDIDFDNADLQTFYDDTTGTSTDYYKVTAYNSLSALTSQTSDPIPATGYTRNHVGRIIDDLMEELGLIDQNQVSRSLLMEWMNEVNDDLETRTSRPYQCLKIREAFTRTAGANYLAYPTFSDGSQKMWKLDFIEYNFTDSTTTPVTDRMDPIRIVSLEEFIYSHPDNTIDSTTESDQLQIAALDDARQYIRYWPPSLTTRAATFYLHYWKYITRFTTEGQAIELPNPKIYKDYCRAKFYRRVAKKETSYLQLSDRFMSDYSLEVAKLPRLNRKDSGSPRSFGARGGRSFKGFRRY